MPGEYYFGDRPDQSNSLIRKILIFVCLGMLLSATVIFGVLYLNNAKLSKVLPVFEASLDAHEYDKALTMYRDIQSRVLGEDPNLAEKETREHQVMTSMEDYVYARVDSIEASVRTDRYEPSADDRAFLEQMGELTGARMTIWLQSLCREYLLGTIEKPTLEYIFQQIGSYKNVVAAAEPLKKEIDTIEKYRGDVQTAESYFSSESYILAVEKFEAIINATTGFVKEYSQTRLLECEKVMYDPIMKECDQLLSTFKYYSAEDILSDMARIFPDDQKVQAKLLEATSNTSQVVDYTGKIDVICMKPLIADTALAFSAANVNSTDSVMLTTDEFKAILAQLYANNYILIDVHLMVDMTNQGSVVQQTLKLPEGKKPIVIVLENDNYSAYLYGKGLCNRLVMNDQGQICGEYKNAQGQTVVKRDAEAIGILDTFVEQHPDFSYDGAKGVVSFTGYETVMGYITNADQLDDRNAALTALGLPTVNPSDQDITNNQNTVKAIMNQMKDTGWSLASSTYGFINANSCNLETITNDTSKWLSQVGSLTGAVDIMVYPNGDFIKGSDPRCVYLKDNGFRIFMGVGPTAYYAFGDNYLYLDRAMLNGATLRGIDYSRLFKSATVYDAKRTVR